MTAVKPNVLILCTGNSARSQIGEALLRHYAGDRFEVFSAGTEPKGMNPYTPRVMQERGIDVSQQWSKSISEYMGKIPFRYVITVCGHADQNCPAALWAHGGLRMHWPFDDPAAAQGSDEDKLAAFRTVRDQIEARVLAWLYELDAHP